MVSHTALNLEPLRQASLHMETADRVCVQLLDQTNNLLGNTQAAKQPQCRSVHQVKSSLNGAAIYHLEIQESRKSRQTAFNAITGNHTHVLSKYLPNLKTTGHNIRPRGHRGRTKCPRTKCPGQNVPGQKAPGQNVPRHNVPMQKLITSIMY